jgi:peptidoglycan/xylan/chitin deacetylase (PgdA/CDA1 family)
LSWVELRTLASEGVSIAPLSCRHAPLDQLSPEDAAAEVAGSRLEIEQEIGSCPPVWAHAGKASPAGDDALTRAGFQVAFNSEDGLNDLRWANWLDLRRITVQREDGLARFRKRLYPILTVGRNA